MLAGSAGTTPSSSLTRARELELGSGDGDGRPRRGAGAVHDVVGFRAPGGKRREDGCGLRAELSASVADGKARPNSASTSSDSVHTPLRRASGARSFPRTAAT